MKQEMRARHEDYMRTHPGYSPVPFPLHVLWLHFLSAVMAWIVLLALPAAGTNTYTHWAYCFGLFLIPGAILWIRALWTIRRLIVHRGER
jgi:hypothetical protein